MMQLHRFNDPHDFWHTAQDYLLQHQAEHNLLLGVVHTLLHTPDRYPHPPYLAIVETRGKVLAAAICTPPYKLVLSKAQDLQALSLIAQDLYDTGIPLPGVSGTAAEVEAFLQIWQALTEQDYHLVMAMRIHQLSQVEVRTPARGTLRPATDSDRPLLLQWLTDFAAGIGDVVRESAAVMVAGGLKRQSIYLWEDGIPVSLVCGSRAFAGVGRVGPVYTPPEYRRKGYATAGTAALSQHLLDQGCDRCFLFTDQANPTSNHIYREVGYDPVCDWYDYSFTLPEQP